jgi:serine/threonine protein kinase
LAALAIRRDDGLSLCSFAVSSEHHRERLVGNSGHDEVSPEVYCVTLAKNCLLSIRPVFVLLLTDWLHYSNILKDLHHEHIVRYQDHYVDRHAGILDILMQYCGGGVLSMVIN